MRGGRLLLVALCGPCVAWVGAGDGDARWSAGEGKRLEARPRAVGFEAVAQVRPDAPTHVVLTIALGDRDGVLTLVASRDGRVELPSRHVRVRYDEYDADGRRVFQAGEVDGSVALYSGPRAMSGEVVLRLFDVDAPAEWRVFERASFEVRPVVEDVESGGRGGYDDDGADHLVVSGGGCDGDYEETDDGYDDGGGCEGDDYDSGAGDGGGGDGDGAGSSSSGGGCEGDDLGGAGDSGCAGDAVAAPSRRCPRVRRSRWVMRAMSWTPWLAVFCFIRVMRRRDL